jgi:hypothetical protein
MIIAGAVYLMVRRVEVRLVLLGAGLSMALLAGSPLSIADFPRRRWHDWRKRCRRS